MYMRTDSFSHNNKKHGFILLSVMFTVTLLISTAVGFAWFARTQAQRYVREIHMVQTERVADIAAKRATLSILMDNNCYDSCNEKLYNGRNPGIYEIDNFTVVTTVTPLNNKININEVFLPDRVTVRSEYKYVWNEAWRLNGHPEMSDIVLDFIDMDEKQRSGGGEYPYNINRSLSDISELLLIPGINKAMLFGSKEEREKGHIPLNKFFTDFGSEKININVAVPEVLAILDEKIGMAGAQSIVAYRNLYPIQNIESLDDIPAIPPGVLKRLTNVITFQSTHFKIQVTVQDNSNKEIRKFIFIIEKQKEGTTPFKLVKWRE